MRIELSEEDHRRLVETYERARTTPYLVFGSMGQNTASSAWAHVRQLMDELGQKYGYNPRTANISMDSNVFEAEAVSR